MRDLAKAAGAIKKVFNPDKINYASFGDKVQHIYFHLVPKYKDGKKWVELFDVMPEDKVYLESGQYKKLIEELRNAL